MLLAAGTASYGQTRWLTIVPSLSSDTVLVLDKRAAVNQANFNREAFSIKERLNVALHREDKLKELWQSTKAEKDAALNINRIQMNEIANLLKTIEDRDSELEATVSYYKGKSRKNLFIGLGIGVVTGIVGTSYLIIK